MSETRERRILAEAAACYQANDLERAEVLCSQLLRRDRRSVSGHELAGLIALKKRQWSKSKQHYRRCMELVAREARFVYLMGKVYMAEHLYEKAIQWFDKALRINPDYQPAIAWKAMGLERQARFDEARQLVEPFVKAGTEDAEMAEVYAKLETRAGRMEEAVRVIDRQQARADLKPLSRQVLGFYKGKALEKAGEYDAAFDAYTQANACIVSGFDPEAYERSIDQLMEVFEADWLATRGGGGHRTDVPVFIVGMPRSGTTLIEQIIDRHPDAYGAGEITDMEMIAEDLQAFIGSDRSWPMCVVDLTQRAAENLGRRYMRNVQRLARSARALVNKSLENYKLLGLISLLLPDARIIHCTRDALDNCLSCYFSPLMPPRHAYAFDILHIAFVYKQYLRLMRHWREALDIRILDISYEDLIDHQEDRTREIIGFCGLDWDERCLKPHESGRVAESLSYDQVRMPVYRSSVGRWRRFETHLGPLREALSGGKPGSL